MNYPPRTSRHSIGCAQISYACSDNMFSQRTPITLSTLHNTHPTKGFCNLLSTIAPNVVTAMSAPQFKKHLQELLQTTLNVINISVSPFNIFMIVSKSAMHSISIQTSNRLSQWQRNHTFATSWSVASSLMLTTHPPIAHYALSVSFATSTPIPLSNVNYATYRATQSWIVTPSTWSLMTTLCISRMIIITFHHLHLRA